MRTNDHVPGRTAFPRRIAFAGFVLPIAVLGLTTALIAPLVDLTDAIGRDDPSPIEALPEHAVTLGIVTLLMSWTTVAKRQFPADRQRGFAWPLAIASGCSILIAAAAATPVDSTATALALIAAAAAVSALAASSAGYIVARRLIGNPKGVDVHDPPPIEALRTPVSPRSTAVWSGRAAAVERWHRPFVLNVVASSVLLIAVVVWMFVLGDPATAILTFSLIILPQLLNACFQLNTLRVRVLIGPAGFQIRGGLVRRVVFDADLDQIASAWITDAPAANFWGKWGKESKSKQLLFLTRKGPALLVRLTDGTDVVVALDDPSTPAGVLNTLIDRHIVAC